MGTVLSFDTRGNAGGNNLSGVDVVVLLGYSAKNDGGGGRYERLTSTSSLPLNYPVFTSTDGGASGSTWGLVPEAGMVNPLQFGATGTGVLTDDDRVEVQACIDYIDYWNQANGTDTSKTLIKMVLPAKRTFVIDATPKPSATGLVLKGPITIEGEDVATSRLYFLETSTDVEPKPPSAPLFLAENQQGIVLRDFTMEGSFKGLKKDHGVANLIKFTNLRDVLFERVTFTHNRAVIISGSVISNLTMRGCILSESRRGGLIITDADRVVVEDNDFRWVSDDTVAITWLGSSTDLTSLSTGGQIRITGNRCLGCRGLNVVGAKNVLIADNSHVLGRGRAIHVGTTTFQQKGDTPTLNVVIRNNIVTDLLDAAVDPSFEQDSAGHRAIDLELLYAGFGGPAPNPPVVPAIPGFPNSNGSITDPATYYYTDGQGRQESKVWASGSDITDVSDRYWWLGNIYTTTSTKTGIVPPTHTSGMQCYDNGDDPDVCWTWVDGKPTPQSGTFLVEGNVISRTRMPTDSFDLYGVGKFGGEIGVVNANGDQIIVKIAITDLIPSEGIAISGAAHAVTIRGNQVRDCDKSLSFDGPGGNVPIPFYLQDIFVVDNDLSDWITAAVSFTNYKSEQPQRIMILYNRADGDPLHKSDLRVKSGGRSTGSWLSGTLGSFIDPIDVSYIVIAGNHVKNVSRLVSNYGAPTLAALNHVMQDNVAYCQPFSLGYSVNNVGVGTVIEPERGWRYIIEGSNPKVPSDYGRLLNACPLAIKLTTSPPQTEPAGSGWVEGTFVRNIAPSRVPGSTFNYEVAGWRRSSSGWIEQRVLVA